MNLVHGYSNVFRRIVAVQVVVGLCLTTIPSRTRAQSVLGAATLGAAFQVGLKGG